MAAIINQPLLSKLKETASVKCSNVTSHCQLAIKLNT